MRIGLLLVVILIGMTWFWNDTSAEEQVNSDYVVIPDDAIRLRILANSNSEADQQEKRDVRDAVNEQITEWVEDLTSIEKARQTIRDNIPVIKTIVEKHTSYSFNVEFDDVMFPDKVYDKFIYPAGEYEAILITLGEGKGDNWWCVLFPPLCFVEFSDGAAVLEHDEEEETTDSDEKSDDERETKFFIWEWLKNLLNWA
ncbi:stage II sporulation protein R [Alkalibacillus flavidus]|uniref:Stage II sporulation protein R n=1 Tax=Alkalibacillus flavidus TaxID=546021 RepID=A0ABV2KX42_9BACI